MKNPLYKGLPRLPVLLLLLLLPACGYIRKTDTPPAPTSTTLADLNLESIQQQESQFLIELLINEDKIDAYEKHRRAAAIQSAYESFLAHNPQHVYGLILYGKFLRRFDERARANEVFLRANRVDPNLAVVKQQIANYLAEEGLFELALPYLLAAVELEPGNAQYHYQLGELLHTYYHQFLATKAYDHQTLDALILRAFKEAVAQDPTNRDLRLRLAETYYDLHKPDWEEALHQWTGLLASAPSDREKDALQLHRAQVLIQLQRDAEARAIIESIDRPALEHTRRALLEQLNAPTSTLTRRVQIHYSTPP